MLGKQFTLSQTQPKSWGGLGLKKFSLMNQAMLAKQYWGTNHNQNSLLARTFMAKYFSRGSIQNCSPKPHQSWFWRSIIKFDNPKLIGGRWWIGKGNTIPLTHQDWIKTQPHNLNNPKILTHGEQTWFEPFIHILNVLIFCKFPFPRLTLFVISCYGNIQTMGILKSKQLINFFLRAPFHHLKTISGKLIMEMEFGISYG